ncbi:hypothetical protein Tco_0030860 [Tanacetum coccineum]
MDELLQFKLQQVWTLVDLPYGKRAIGTKWIYRNKKDERGIMDRNKARPDIMFDVCACARFQVTPKVSHLHAVKRIFRYLKGQPKLGLWYPKDSPFDLEAYTDSDYVGASLDMKSTTGGCQFLGSRLISWQCKKQTVVSNSTIEAEYVAASNCFKNPVFHSKTKHIEIRHHFIRDSYENILIQVIKIHIDHNVSDLLTKAFNNVDFDEIMDFLNASPNRYALTVSSSIYVSYIEQFWSTAKTKTFNNETQILAKVDGKTIVITESSVRRDLYFNDEDAVFNDEYDTPSHTKKVFVNMRRKRKDFSGTVTPFFPSMLASQVVEGEADETVHEERGDNVERAATTVASLLAKQDSGSGPRRQDTILGDRPAQTRFERLSKQSNDPPLSRVNTLGSGEDSMKLNELMEMCTKLFDRVLDLKNVKDAQDLEINNLKKRGKKLEKKKKSRTPQLKRRLFKVRIESSAEKSLGDQEDASKQRRNEIDQDEEISWFQEDAETQGRYGHDTEINTASTSITTANINITNAEPITTASAPITTAGVSVSTTEPSTPPTTTILIEDEDLTIAQTLIKMRSVKSKETKDDVQVMMDADYELAARLQAEEQGELTIEERLRLLVELMDKRKKHFARLKEEEQRRKPPTKTQKRNQMCTYMKNMVRFTHNQLKNKSFDEVQKAFDKTMSWIDSFVPMDTESSEKKADSSKKRTRVVLDDESVKRQKVENDAEKAKLKACLEIVPSDDSVVNIESLATKYPMIFSAMLDDFNKQDVLDLYRLTKERFETICPEGYDRLLWGDLITLFEPSEEDEIWKNQQDYTLICWRMLSGKLKVDHECEMAFELLRFIKSQHKK